MSTSLESLGLDHGPISTHNKMVTLGMDALSEASLARILRKRLGPGRVAEEAPCRARQACLPCPECLPAIGRHLVRAHRRGPKRVIFQLQDDYSRLAAATHVAPGEPSEAALTVMEKAS